jgi:hypothetical protein
VEVGAGGASVCRATHGLGLRRQSQARAAPRRAWHPLAP